MPTSPLAAGGWRQRSINPNEMLILARPMRVCIGWRHTLPARSGSIFYGRRRDVTGAPSCAVMHIGVDRADPARKRRICILTFVFARTARREVALRGHLGVAPGLLRPQHRPI